MNVCLYRPVRKKKPKPIAFKCIYFVFEGNQVTARTKLNSSLFIKDNCSCPSPSFTMTVQCCLKFRLAHGLVAHWQMSISGNAKLSKKYSKKIVVHPYHVRWFHQDRNFSTRRAFITFIPLIFSCFQCILPLPALTSDFFHFGEILVQKNSLVPLFICRFHQACKSTPVVLSGFPFLIIGFWQRGGKRKIFIKHSSPDNEFSSPFECICGMPEWFITADSEVWQWAAEMTDGIFFLISFPWSSSSLGLCTSIN